MGRNIDFDEIQSLPLFIFYDIYKLGQKNLLDKFFKCGILNVNEYNSEIELSELKFKYQELDYKGSLNKLIIKLENINALEYTSEDLKATLLTELDNLNNKIV